jgi:hypothetical protein
MGNQSIAIIKEEGRRKREEGRRKREEEITIISISDY